MNNKLKLIITILLCSAVLLIGSTYAWYVWQTTGDEETVIATDVGAVKVRYGGGPDIIGEEIYPVSDKSFGIKKEIKISTDIESINDVIFNLYLDVNTLEAGLNEKSFKYEIYKADILVNSGNFSNDYLNNVDDPTNPRLVDCTINNTKHIVLLSNEIVTTTESTYTLYIWIDGTVNNPLTMSNQSFDFTLHADGKHAIMGPFYLNMPNLQEGSLAYNLVSTYNNAEKEEVENNEIIYYYDRTNRLMVDIGGNLRFFGADDTTVSDDIKNYIYFNCSDYSNQSSDTCELWRIIGVFDGKVKIMRNTKLGGLAWDQDYNNGEGKTTFNSDWSNSSLQQFLNGKYYDRGEAVTLDYYIGKYGDNPKTLDLENMGIKEGTRELISETLWHLRGNTTASVFSDEMYDLERNSGKMPVSSWSTIIPGKIAIPYVSDYGYATDFTSCNVKLSLYNNTLCTSTNWMNLILGTKSYGWLMAPYYSLSDYVWQVDSSGKVSRDAVWYGDGVFPVLHLNPELGIEDGDGSQNSPYQLSV